MELKSDLPWPLNQNSDLIDLIASISGEHKRIVTSKLLQEEKCLGWNVRTDLQDRQLPPHHWSEDLAEFYASTNAFLYETSVWNRRPLKQEIRNWICDYLKASFPQPLKILAYGDGLGFDSLQWSQTRHDVTYFEVSPDCIAYAQQVFKKNNAEINILQSITGLEPDSFDVIICLDVLEHVPEPSFILADFTKWLKVDGLLITLVLNTSEIQAEIQRLYEALYKPRTAACSQSPVLGSDCIEKYQASFHQIKNSLEHQTGRSAPCAGTWLQWKNPLIDCATQISGTFTLGQ